MKDELTMKTPTTLDGSRFGTSPKSVTPIAASSVIPVSRSFSSRFTNSLPDESLVVDDRSHLSPAQMVETKLIHRLKESSMPVSHLQMMGLVKKRYEG